MTSIGSLPCATQGSKGNGDLQPPVANSGRTVATFCCVRKDWTNYWRDVCAPKLKARKATLGRKVPEREIAAAVEAATGKSSQRGLVSLWLLGEREPYISQFFALCIKLGMDPMEVLEPPTRKRHAAIQGSESVTQSSSPDRQRSRRRPLDSKVV